MKARAFRRNLLVLLAVVLVGCAVIGAYIYHDYGQAERATRLSALLNIRNPLVGYACRHGRYPDSLWDAVPRTHFLYDLEQMPLDYPAAGKAYPLEEDTPLFSDRAALRYGFEVGWFEFYEHDWTFHEGRKAGHNSSP